MPALLLGQREGEGLDRGLAHVVRRAVAGVVRGGHRRDHHDVAPRPRAHGRQDEPAQVVGPDGVGADDPRHLGRIGVGHRVAPDATPPLLTRMSIAPKSATTASTMRGVLLGVVDAGLVGAGHAARRLDGRHRRGGRLRRPAGSSRRRPRPPTRAAREMPRPIPRPPPVTSATRPSSCPIAPLPRRARRSTMAARRSLCQPTTVHEGSRRAIIAALLANLGIAIAKFVGFVVTRSASLLAEAVHSLADTGNQGLLLLRRPPGRSGEPPPTTRSATGASATSGRSSSPLVLFLARRRCSPSTRASRSCATRTSRESLGWPSASCSVAMVLEGFSLRTAVHEAQPVARARARGWRFIRRSQVARAPGRAARGLGRADRPVPRPLRRGLAEVTGNGRWDARGLVGDRRAARASSRSSWRSR